MKVVVDGLGGTLVLSSKVVLTALLTVLEKVLDYQEAVDVCILFLISFSFFFFF